MHLHSEQGGDGAFAVSDGSRGRGGRRLMSGLQTSGRRQKVRMNVLQDAVRANLLVRGCCPRHHRMMVEDLRCDAVDVHRSTSVEEMGRCSLADDYFRVQEQELVMKS
jgi:hypothetical protein